MRPPCRTAPVLPAISARRDAQCGADDASAVRESVHGRSAASSPEPDRPAFVRAGGRRPGGRRPVPHRPAVVPVHPRRWRPARRTRHRRIPGAGRDHHLVTVARHVLDDHRRQPGKHRPDEGANQRGHRLRRGRRGGRPAAFDLETCEQRNGVRFPRRGSPRVDRPLASAAPPRGRGSGQRDVRGAGARSLPLPCLSVRRVSGVRRPAPVRPRRTTR